MTFIDPTSGNVMSTSFVTEPNKTAAPTNEFGQDTFLKLLVAQLKYQNPMAPKDGTEFLTQAAQFTQIETLQKIEKLMTVNSAATEVLEASAMVGRRVMVALPVGQAGKPIASTSMSFGGSLQRDAAVGTRVDATMTVLTLDGTKVPLRAQLTKLADSPTGDSNWEMRTFSSTTQISGPHTITFDANGNRTSVDPVITSAELDEVPSARGRWNAVGLTLKLGSASDPGRLHVENGPSGFIAREHNGSDGVSIIGVVNGVRFTIDGPMLKLGMREIHLNNVLEVHVA